MSKSLAKQAEEIFIAACDLEPSEQSTYLDEACAGDAELRREVDALLEASADSDAYFADLPQRLGVAKLLGDEFDTAGPDDEVRVGARDQQFGHYTLTESVGSGGMGSVWRANRSDGRFEGEYAVKLPAHTGGAAAVRRFSREGRYLARLAHPNIARLLDAGVGELDQPYLVLEFIDGVSIDRYCDDRGLDVEKRIRLFLNVLDAVSHAHARLVVHRDIKPSNVLVTGDGTVKLLDFGVAKLLSDEHIQGDSALTRQAGAPLTPEFAAPEQILGDNITTSTDVYSLGLLLWLLLTGRNPRDTGQVQSMAELRSLATQEPSRMVDTVSDPAALRDLAHIASRRSASSVELLKTLRSDLDSVVRKALAVDPEDRYTTVADFSADLRRYLRHEPVMSQVHTMAYRTRKFVRRHRGGVLSVSLTILALLSAAVITTWQSIEARRQRDTALYQQQRAQATNEFLNFLFEELGPTGEPMTLLELTDRGVDMLEQQYGTEPRFVGRVLYELATPYFTLGKLDRLENLLQMAESAARTNYDPDLLAAILCLKARATLQTSDSGAEDLLTEARQLLSARPVPSIDAVASCSRTEALLLEAAGDRQTAASLLESTLVRLRAEPVPSIRDEIFIMNELSKMYYNMRDMSRTLELNNRILQRMDETGRGQSLGYIIITMNRAALLQVLGEVKSAHDARRKLLTRLESLGRGEQLSARLMTSYAGSLLRLGRYDEALAVYRDGREAAAGAGDERLAVQLDMQIGRALVLSGRFDDAEPHLERAAEFLTQRPGMNERLLDILDVTRAQLLLGKGDQDAAAALIDAELAEKGYPEDRSNPSLIVTLRIGAVIAIQTGDAARAETFATEFHELAVARARDPVRSADVGLALLLRAKARLETDDEHGAADDLARAVPSLANGVGDDHPDTVEARALLDRLND